LLSQVFAKVCREKEIGRVARRARPIAILIVDAQSKGVAPSADAAVALHVTAATAAATAATASASPAATATAATAATTTTAPGHLLHGAALLLVEQVEGGETHISDFLFAERDRLGWHEVQFLRRICCRICRCGSTPRKAEGQARSAQRRHGGFCNSLRFRSLFHSSHRRISSFKLFRIISTVSTPSSRRDHSFDVGATQGGRLH
jgi:hypothetical protein